MEIRLRPSPLRVFALLLLLLRGAAWGVAAAPGGASDLAYETVAEGKSLTLEAEVGGGDAPFTYQWFKDGAPLAGETRPRFELAAAGRSDAGLYAVVVANQAGSAASLPIMLTVFAARPSRLTNVSIVAAASEPVLVGFTLGAGSLAEINRLLVRAAGPALVQLGVPVPLPDPVLELVGPDGVVAFNDDWGGTGAVTAAAAAVGAFSFPAGSRDAALIADLPPGSYTARVTDGMEAAGTTAVELYELNASAVAPASRVVNLSARAATGSASPFTLGFTIAGFDPVRILLRGVGPTLSRFGVTNPIANPRLDLFRSSTRVGGNDDWSEMPASEMTAAAAAVGAFTLPAGSRDAALLVALEPGSYTVQLNSDQDLPGLALIELYEVP